MEDGIPPIAPAGKYTRAEIEERQEAVYELYFVRGMSISAIASIQGVSAGTTSKDVRAIKERMAQQLRDMDKVEEVAIQASYYDQIRRDAMIEFSRETEPKAKAAYLLMALKAVNQKGHFLINTGVFPSAKQRIDLEVRKAISEEDVGDRRFAEMLNDPTQCHQVMGFLERVMGNAPVITASATPSVPVSDSAEASPTEEVDDDGR